MHWKNRIKKLLGKKYTGMYGGHYMKAKKLARKGKLCSATTSRLNLRQDIDKLNKVYASHLYTIVVYDQMSNIEYLSGPNVKVLDKKPEPTTHLRAHDFLFTDERIKVMKETLKKINKLEKVK